MGIESGNPNPGQTTAANSLPVVLSSDTALPSGTNTIGSVQNASATTAIVLSSTGDFFLSTGMLKYSGVAFDVTGTWVGTIQAFASFDGGTTYRTLPVVSITDTEATTALSVTANGTYFFPICADLVKISMTAYTSGSATVRTASTTGYQNPSLNPLTAQIAKVRITSSYVPQLPYTVTGTGYIVTDADNQAIFRGDVLTDEGQFRDDFTGAALDATRWTATFSGTGANVTVGSSLVNIISGTANAATARIVATGDYGPISMRAQFSLSQRIANQTTRVGFADNIVTPGIGAYFEFTGTTNTTVSCISRSSTAAADTQTTTSTIPNGTSATSNDYYIEVQPDQISFFINNQLVANHSLHMPGPYDAIDVCAYIVNAAIVTTTTLAIDYMYLINQNSLQVNNSFQGDALPIKMKTGTIATYSAAVTALTVAATATDIFTITGSATKTIKIKHLSMNGTQTTAGNVDLLLLRRSTANTAGASTTLTNVPFDSLNPAGTATVRAYTVNPTRGTLVGTLHNKKLFVPTATGLGDEWIFQPTPDSNAQEITLRGVNEVLAINLNGVSVGGSSFDIDITWTEE